MSVRAEVVPFRGWRRALRIANGSAEIVATLDVGPRILSFTVGGGTNPFAVFEEQAGGTGEPEWKNRGGHRLWLAPEAPDFSYFPDNRPVAWEALGDGGVRLTPPPEAPTGFQKQIDIRLADEGARATLVHRIIRVGDGPRVAAPWALSVLAPGGFAVLPQPAMGRHPRDLLPNRRLVLWPYTDLSDPRYRFGRRLFTLRQDTALGPTKIGMPSPAGWAGYWLGGTLFRKRFAREPGAAYPDDGCNLEVFTNSRMLELETLGPLRTLAPGDQAELTEEWDLQDGLPTLAHRDEEAIAEHFPLAPAM
jgi:hypothetical protein